MTWLDVEMLRHDTDDMRLFAETMQSVAGRPPAVETMEPEAIPLETVHVMDAAAGDPLDYRFRHHGWVEFHDPVYNRTL